MQWLALDGVDQRIELRAKPAHTDEGRYSLQIYDWGGQHLRAEVIGWVAPTEEVGASADQATAGERTDQPRESQKEG